MLGYFSKSTDKNAAAGIDSAFRIADKLVDTN